MDAQLRFFASDNAAAAHPEVMAAIQAANQGHSLAYGHDPLTEIAEARFREHFGERAEPLLLFGGTGANVVALAPLVQAFEAVVCAHSSHLYCDECGAPERFLGTKLLPVPGRDGKLAPADLDRHVPPRPAVHHAQPGVLSIAQPTELGTVYSTNELKALADYCRERGWRLHVDGARLANAAVALGVDLDAFGERSGIDALSFGGTKNGLLGAEAVLYFDAETARRGRYLRKQAAQLPSKMRFLAAQFDALLSGDLWRRNA